MRGQVTDAQGAGVPGAAVTLTRLETNTVVTVTTNNSGHYEAPLLLPGQYTMAVESRGFKRAVRTGIELRGGMTVDADAMLEVGQVSETITVTVEAPLIDVSTLATGRVLTERELTELPAMWSNVTNLVQFTPGVIGPTTNQQTSPHGNTLTQNLSDQIGRRGTSNGNEWTMDGAPNAAGLGNRRAGLQPVAENVAEMRVETSNFDAAIGHSSGLQITVLTKSGTNAVHGDLAWRHRQRSWEARNFVQRQQGVEFLPGRTNDYVASVGGPVVIPKVLNGKNKLFFFGSFAGYKIVNVGFADSINYKTIPDPAYYQGDFSGLLNVTGRAAHYTIHDPASARAVGNVVIRTAFPGNMVPRDRFLTSGGQFKSLFVERFLRMYPAPNQTVVPTLDPVRNFFEPRVPDNGDYRNTVMRGDYVVNEKNRVFFSTQWFDWNQDSEDWNVSHFRGVATTGQFRRGQMGIADWVSTLSPSTVLNVNIGATEYNFGRKKPVPWSYKPSDFGLPAYIDDFAGKLTSIPTLSLAGYVGLGDGSVQPLEAWRQFAAKVDLNMIRGGHSIKFGANARQRQQRTGGAGNVNGLFSYGNEYTRAASNTPAAQVGNLGHSVAALLLGAPTSATIEFNDSRLLNNPYYAFYFNDNWRVSRKLTISFGLRAEYELGGKDSQNRVIGTWDPDMVLPFSSAAEARYAARPLPELAPTYFKVRGGVRYAGRDGAPERYWPSELMWAPRASLAYQFAPRTVFRIGYGMFFDSFNVLHSGTPDQTGFSQTTLTQFSLDQGLTFLGNPAATLPNINLIGDPFPTLPGGGRFVQPVGAALGSVAKAGGSFSFISPDMRHLRLQRYRAGMQHQIGDSMVLEVAYAGIYADRIGMDFNLNQLPMQYYGFDNFRNPLANYLTTNAGVGGNPFTGTHTVFQQSDPGVFRVLNNVALFTSQTRNRGDLLRRYPHMGAVTERMRPAGLGRSHAMEVSLQRRMRNGLSLNAGLTLSKASQAALLWNDWDLKPVWTPNAPVPPVNLFILGLYELPFGKGRPFLVENAVLRAIASGWQISASYQHATGELLTFGNMFYNGGDPRNLISQNPNWNEWFNVPRDAAGRPLQFEWNPARQPSFNARVFPYTIDGLRVQNANWINANVARSVNLVGDGRVRLELRLDASNAINATRLGAPNTNPTNVNFGRVVTTNGGQRNLQVQARIRF
ncbi:MAG: carboxypeptidase-like regulatory domain-containing protein [Bryobacteraceae bacterium]